MKIYDVEATLVNEYGKIAYKYKFKDAVVQSQLSATFTKGEKSRVWFSESEVAKVASNGCQLRITACPIVPQIAVGQILTVSNTMHQSIL